MIFFCKACLHPIDEQLLEDDNLAAAADLKRYLKILKTMAFLEY